jgi:hypothetical protein
MINFSCHRKKTMLFKIYLHIHEEPPCSSSKKCQIWTSLTIYQAKRCHIPEDCMSHRLLWKLEISFVRHLDFVVQEVPNLDVLNYLPDHTVSHFRRLVCHTDCCGNLKSRLNTSMHARGIQNPDTRTLVSRILPGARQPLPIPLSPLTFRFSSECPEKLSSLCPL